MFYVNTTTKKFTSQEYFQLSNSIPCGCGYCCEGTDVPLFLRTKVIPVSSVMKPYLTHYETASFEIQFRDAQGIPYDLTDTSLILAVDNTFQHSDSLVCLSSDIEITDPLNGIAKFTVKCSSQKFGKLVAVKMPQNQIWMQITAYTRDNLQGTVLLLDRGIHLQPKLYTTQGEPEPLDPNYYTKQQIDIMFLDYSNSVPLQTIATKDDLRNLQAQISDSLQDIRDTFDEYYTKEETDERLLQISNSLTAIKDSFGNYYTKAEVDGFVSELSNSIASVKSTFDNYYNKTDIDERFVEVCSNSFALYLQHRIDKVQSDALVIQGHLQSEIDKKLDAPVIGTTGQFLRKGANSSYWSDLPLEDYYKKAEVDSLITDLSNSLNAVQGRFDDYYNKDQINGIVRELSNSIDAANARFENYYTKFQIDNFNKNFSNSLAAIKADFDNYYTKQQSDQKFLTEHQDISNKADKIQIPVKVSQLQNDAGYLTEHQPLDDYYTKQQVDTLLAQFSDSIDLSNYYTKAQVDALVAGLSDSIDLSNYYTKAQADVLLSSKQDLSDALQMKTSFEQQLGAFSNSIAAIKDTFSNYYTKAETDELLAEFSNSDIEDLQNRVAVLENKPEVSVKGAGAVSAQGNSSLYTVSLNVDDNIFGTVGQLTSKLTMVKLQTPTQGFAATYQLQGADGNPIGDKINIIQDIFIHSASFIPHATAEDVLSDSSVILNDPYLKFVFYVQQDSSTQIYQTVYVPVKELVDTYTAGRGLVLSGSQFYIQSDSSSDTANYLVIGQHTIGLKGITNAISTALNSYYTKTQINTLISNLSNSFNAQLDNYYTKIETDILIEQLSNSISALKDKFGSYYTKTEADNLLDNKLDLSDALQMSNAISALQQVRIQTVTLSNPQSNVCTVTGAAAVVAIIDNNNTYYPVQKETVSYSSGNTLIHLAAYLAYGNQSTFTGTWKAVIAYIG